MTDHSSSSFRASPFESLTVWQKAHQLVLRVYRLIKSFPKEEQYGLTSQLCRAAASVPTNIVEGNSRKHRAEYLHFLYTARASLEETKYHLLLAKDLHYLDFDLYREVVMESQEVGKLLNGLIASLSKKLP